MKVCTEIAYSTGEFAVDQDIPDGRNRKILRTSTSMLIRVSTKCDRPQSFVPRGSLGVEQTRALLIHALRQEV